MAGDAARSGLNFVYWRRDDREEYPDVRPQESPPQTERPAGNAAGERRPRVRGKRGRPLFEDGSQVDPSGCARDSANECPGSFGETRWYHGNAYTAPRPQMEMSVEDIFGG